MPSGEQRRNGSASGMRKSGGGKRWLMMRGEQRRLPMPRWQGRRGRLQRGRWQRSGERLLLLLLQKRRRRRRRRKQLRRPNRQQQKRRDLGRGGRREGAGDREEGEPREAGHHPCERRSSLNIRRVRLRRLHPLRPRPRLHLHPHPPRLPLSRHLPPAPVRPSHPLPMASPHLARLQARLDLPAQRA